MGGRGRGRGKPLVALGGDIGLGKTEILPPILQPPPSYPPLDYKPLPTTITHELRYFVQLKKDFTEFMHESPNNVLPIVIKKDIDRYSDRYQDSPTKERYETRYDWTRLPAELKRQERKRKGDKTKGPKSKKKAKEVDVDAKLSELENKETNQQSDTEEEDKNDEDTEEKDVENIEDQEEEADEEMDEGTDYVNSYFDNGEDYEDNDENLDDGPIF